MTAVTPAQLRLLRAIAAGKDPYADCLHKGRRTWMLKRMMDQGLLTRRMHQWPLTTLGANVLQQNSQQGQR